MRDLLSEEAIGLKGSFFVRSLIKMAESPLLSVANIAIFSPLGEIFTLLIKGGLPKTSVGI